MKKFLLIFLIIFNLSFSQNFDWATKYLSYQNLGGTGVVHDQLGNSYVVGGWHNNNTHEYFHEGTFLAKYSFDGSLLWNHDLILGRARMTLSSAGLIFVTGYDSSSYILKDFDTTGATHAQIALFSRSQGIVNDLHTDSSGNIYIAGIFWDTLNILDHTVTRNSSANLFLIKLNTNKSIDWILTSSSGDFTGRMRLEVDGAGNAYLGGQFTGLFAVSNQTMQSALYDGYLMKIDASGVLQWKKAISAPGQEYISAITISTSGQIYVAGIFDSPLTINNSTFQPFSQIYPDVFIIKLSPSGGILWSKRIGGSGADLISEIHVNSLHNIYLGGGFINISGTDGFSIDSNTLISNSNVSQEPILAKLDSAGAVIWLSNTGTFSYSKGMVNSITVNSYNRLFATGTIDSVMSLGGHNLRSGAATMFLTRISDNESTGCRQVRSDEIDVLLFPNPTEDLIIARITSKNTEKIVFNVYDMLGNKVLSHISQIHIGTNDFPIRLEKLPKGLYSLKVEINSQSFLSKTITRN